MVDHKNLHGPLGRLQFQPELLLNRRKNGRPQIVVRGGGRRLHGRKVQSDVVLALEAGLVENRVFQKLRQHVHQTGHPNPLASDAARTPACAAGFRRLRHLGSALRRHQEIGRQAPGFAVKRQLEPVRQQRLHHLRNLLALTALRQLGENVVSLRVKPFRPAGELIVVHVIRHLDAGFHRVVAQLHPAGKRAHAVAVEVRIAGLDGRHLELRLRTPSGQCHNQPHRAADLSRDLHGLSLPAAALATILVWLVCRAAVRAEGSCFRALRLVSSPRKGPRPAFPPPLSGIPTPPPSWMSTASPIPPIPAPCPPPTTAPSRTTTRPCSSVATPMARRRPSASISSRAKPESSPRSRTSTATPSP